MTEKWALVPAQKCNMGPNECLRLWRANVECAGCLGNGYRITGDAHMVRVTINMAGKPIAVDHDE